jgi:hypothetical protein
MSSPSRRSWSDVTEWATVHQRAMAVAVFAIVGVLAVIAAVIVSGMIGDRPTAGVLTTPSPSLPAASPTAQPTADPASTTPMPSAASPIQTPTTSGRPLAEGWVEVGSFGTDGSIDAVHDVVQAPFGLLAAGVRIGTQQLPVFGPLPQEGRIWMSSDGLSWEDVTPSGPFADSSVYDLVALPDGAVIAFARLSVFVEGAPQDVLSAWETTDGRTWTGAEVSAGTSPVWRVAAGGLGFLTAAGPDPVDPQIWHSSDGRTFIEVSDPTGQRPVTAMEGGPEGFVILGSLYESSEPARAYASADGLVWYEATTGEWDVSGIAPIAGDWVGVGPGPFDDEWHDTDTASWFSSNGLEWVEVGRIPLRALPLSAGVSCREFLSEPVSTGHLVVASSTLSYPCGEGQVQRFGAAHITSDGAAWTALPFTLEASPGDEGTRGASVNAGLDLDFGTLLVGEKDYRATFWFRPSD